VAYHGAPRFNGDPDVAIRPDAQQAGRMPDVLGRFGFPAQEVDAG
jgi:hypothetical protein